MSPVIPMIPGAEIPAMGPRVAQGRLAAPATGGAIRHRVVYCDTDAMGVVYHGRYLDIAERSRTVLIAEAGIDLGALDASHGIWLLVNRVRADYRRPVLLHETADVTSHVLKSGASQVWWRTQIRVGQELAANIDVGTACFDTASKIATSMPPELAAQIATLPTSQENDQ